MKIQRIIASSAVTLSLLGASALPIATLANEGGMETVRTTPNVDAACMKTAIDKRETAVINAMDAYNVSIKSAYQARKSALLSAWDKTERKERRQAQQEARKAFKESAKAARETLRDARKSAWETFGTDAKACGGNAKDEGSAREDQGVTI